MKTNEPLYLAPEVLYRLGNASSPLLTRVRPDEIDEKLFNLIWRSLLSREEELETEITEMREGTDEAALIGNDLVYLRMCKNHLLKKAKEERFSKNAFSIEDDFIDLKHL